MTPRLIPESSDLDQPSSPGDVRLTRSRREWAAIAGLISVLLVLAGLTAWTVIRSDGERGEYADRTERVTGHQTISTALNAFDRLEDRYEDHPSPVVAQRVVATGSDFRTGLTALRDANPGNELAAWLEPRYERFYRILGRQFGAEDVGNGARAEHFEGVGVVLLERLKNRVEQAEHAQVVETNQLAERERAEHAPLLWLSLLVTALALLLAAAAARFLSARRRNDVLAAGRDLERAQSDQERVQESEGRLIEAQGLARIGSWELDPGSGRIRASKEALRLYGLDPEGFDGRIDSILPQVHPDDRAFVAERFLNPERSIGAGGSSFETEYRVLTSEGVERTLEVRGHLLTRPDGTRVVAGTSQDVGERMEKEGALRGMAEAERANQAKSDFLSRMSHELRTPLHSVLGYGQLLEESDELSDEARDDAGQIVRAGKHLLKLIDEVLDISQIEDGRIMVEFEPVDLGTAAIEAYGTIGPLADEHGVSVEIIDSDQVGPAFADARLVHQILLNLLSNAVKYNREGGEVTLELTPRCGSVRVSVADTGIGIPAEMQERIFIPFDRLGADAGLIQGTGLGLTVSERLCAAMGSSLEFESEPGTGSRFWFDLVAVSTSSAGDQPLAGDDQPFAREPARALVAA